MYELGTEDADGVVDRPQDLHFMVWVSWPDPLVSFVQGLRWDGLVMVEKHLLPDRHDVLIRL